MINEKNYYIKDADTPDWASLAIINLKVDVDKGSIDETFTFLPPAPASVTLRLNRTAEYRDSDQMEKIYRNSHRTIQWLHDEGLIEEAPEDDFEDWIDSVAGFLFVVDELPKEDEEEVPLEIVESMPE